MTDRQNAVKVLARALAAREGVTAGLQHYADAEALCAPMLSPPLDADVAGLVLECRHLADEVAAACDKAGQRGIEADTDDGRRMFLALRSASALIEAQAAELARLRADLDEAAKVISKRRLQHLSALGQQAEALDKASSPKRAYQVGYIAGRFAGIRDAEAAIAALPTGKSEDVSEGQEQAFRAVEQLRARSAP